MIIRLVFSSLSWLYDFWGSFSFLGILYFLEICSMQKGEAIEAIQSTKEEDFKIPFDPIAVKK